MQIEHWVQGCCPVQPRARRYVNTGSSSKWVACTGAQPKLPQRVKAGITIHSMPQEKKLPYVLWGAYSVLSLSWPLCPCFHPLIHIQTLSGYKLQAEGRESIISISWENSGSVITLSQAIKLLPRSDRWQMLEGLFIFCLLIRAARRGGAPGGERTGVWGRDTRRKGGRLTERRKSRKAEHLVPREAGLLLVIQRTVHVPPFDLPEFMSGAWHFWCGRSVIRQGYVKGSQATGEWLSMISRWSESPASYH